MIKFFQKKKDKSIDVIISSTILEDTKEDFVKNIIEPSLKSSPEWWKSLRVNMMKELGAELKLNVKTCPAFIELFKNSYVIKSPCDFMFESKAGEYWKFHTSNENLAQAEDHGFDIQMNNFSNGSIYNFKLKLPITLKSSKGSGIVKLVYMQPYYHNYKHPLTVMPGVLPLVENMNINLAINYGYENKKHIKHIFKKGDVLAYLYCTENILPKLNVVQSEAYGNWKWYINKFTSSYIDNLKEQSK